MNILIFTHGTDIDGMGSPILCNLISDNVDVCFCETKDIDELFREKILALPNVTYSHIFITDTCLGIELLEYIDNSNLKNIVRIFDHHANQLKQNKDRFGFVELKAENENGLCSGTSLFYDYLIKNNLIKATPVINEFVEYTRQYDTFEWDYIYHNEMPHEMTILYDYIGNEDYIKAMLDIIRNNNKFIFTDMQRQIVEYEKRHINEIVKNKVDNIIEIEINGIKGGLVFSDRYTNEFRPYYEKNCKDGDLRFITIVDMNLNQIFYRAVGDFITTDLVISQGGSGNRKTGYRHIKNEEIVRIGRQLILK